MCVLLKLLLACNELCNSHSHRLTVFINNVKWVASRYLNVYVKSKRIKKKNIIMDNVKHIYNAVFHPHIYLKQQHTYIQKANLKQGITLKMVLNAYLYLIYYYQ